MFDWANRAKKKRNKKKKNKNKNKATEILPQ